MDKYFLCIYLKYFLLQELQHEVSSLLEFKNVLLQTFPDLHHKISSLSSVSGQDVRHLATRGLKTEAGGDISDEIPVSWHTGLHPGTGSMPRQRKLRKSPEVSNKEFKERTFEKFNV